MLIALYQLRASVQKAKQYINGISQEIRDDIPTNNNQLENGAGYQTEPEVEPISDSEV